MKKNLKKFLNFTLFTAFISSSFISAKATDSANSIESKLAPYQVIIDKINAEYNSSISIDQSNFEEVYNNVKNMSIEEFEKQTREDYLEALKTSKQISYNADEKENNNGSINNKKGGFIEIPITESVEIPTTESVEIPHDTSDSIILLK